MREEEIRREIWKIIKEEIRNGMTFAKRSNLGDVPNDFDEKKHTTVFDVYTERIKKRINKLLNEHEAILVYQP